MTTIQPQNHQNSEPSRAQRIGASLFWSQAARVLDIALGLLLAIVIVRTLGPEIYSVYAIAWAIAGVGILFSALGYSEALTRYIPLYQREKPSSALALTRRLGVERIALGVVLAGTLWLLSEPISTLLRMPALSTLGGWIAALVISQSLLDPLIAYFTATLRMRDYAVVRTLAQSLSLVCVGALFLTLGAQAWIPLFATVLASLLSVGIYLSRIPTALDWVSIKSSLGDPRRFGIYVWLTNLATFGLTSQINVLLIAALLTDNTQIGFFNLAVLLLGRLYSVLTGWTAAVIPVAADAYARNAKSGLVHNFDAFMKLNMAMVLPAFIFVAAYAKPLIVFLFGDAFEPASNLLIVLAFFNLVSTLTGANICNPLLYVANQQRTLLGLRLGAGGLNIVLNLFLISLLGALGAVIGTGVSNLLTHLVELTLLRRHVEFHYPAVTAFKLLLACSLAAMPVFMLGEAGLATLLIGSMLFAVVFVIVVRHLHLLSDDDRVLLMQALPPLQPVLKWLGTK